jgi:HTH-like domain
MRQLEEEKARRRFGYRCLQILLQREGWQINHKRVYRLYIEEKLALRRKRGRKRSTVGQPLPAAAAALRAGLAPAGLEPPEELTT